MGAYAYDYINKAVNNSNYAGNFVATVSKNNLSASASAVASVSTVSTVATEAGSAFSLGNVLKIGGKVLSRANVPLTLLALAKGGYDNLMDYYNSAEYQDLTEDEQNIVKEAVTIAETSQIQEQKTEDLKQDTQSLADSVVYTQGQTLPDVLSQNAKALTQSVNFLSQTLSEQFGLLNNYMMGNLLLQQQFLDLKTQESGLKIDALEFNRYSTMVKDLDSNEIAKLSPREASYIKDATLAKDTTDKINFELDLDLDNLDIDIPELSLLSQNDDFSAIVEGMLNQMKA